MSFLDYICEMFGAEISESLNYFLGPKHLIVSPNSSNQICFKQIRIHTADLISVYVN